MQHQLRIRRRVMINQPIQLRPLIHILRIFILYRRLVDRNHPPRSSTQALFDGKGFPAFRHNQKPLPRPIRTQQRLLLSFRAFSPRGSRVFILVYVLFQAVVNHVSIFPVRTAAPGALQINRTHCRAHEALLPYLPQLRKWQNNGQQLPAGHLLTVLESYL